MNRKEDKDFQTLVLAALLHDIGKFAQRAGAELDAEDRRVAEACCRQAFGHPSHVHAAFSGSFIRRYLGRPWEMVENLALWHHSAGEAPAAYRRLARIVALADWLSSGERHDRPEAATVRVEDEPLVSIFSTLETDRPASGRSYFPLTPLSSTGREHIPSARKPEALQYGRAYKQTWEAFQADFDRIKASGYALLVDQTLSLLEKHTLFVPSAAYRQVPDVSLFHHLKATAAIASCLFQDRLDDTALDQAFRSFGNPAEVGDELAVLIGGDLSGIQDFLYNVTAKAALKSLRGRSLYLQLIPEAVASGLIDVLNLTRANIIYCGGGHFYLLAPATAETKETIESHARMIDQALLSAHNGRLSLALATQPLSLGDFSGREFGNAWDRLHEKLARAKKQRFRRLLQSGRPEDILGPTGVGGEEPACSVCGEETKEKDDEDNPRCRMCAGFADLSADLKNAAVVVETASGRHYDKPRAWYEVLSNLGREYRFQPEAHPTGAAWLLNGTDFAASGLNGFRFLAKHIPEVTGATATLENIAKGAVGVQRWGVLRMDVDNLGEAFRTRLGDDRSVSRFSMLSYLVGYFFSARVQAVAQEDAFKDKVYLAYSGGDDLFAIGSWSVLPEFAKRIREEFGNFTSHALTLSAGVYVAPSVKFPVYEAADQAGEAEKAAKTEHTSKDRISFLGSTVTWAELNNAREVKDELVKLIGNGLPKSILGFLGSSWQQQKETKDGKIPVYPIWRLLYAFKRLKERHKDLAPRICDIEQKVVVANGLRPRLDLIIRWAEYEVRRKDAE